VGKLAGHAFSGKAENSAFSLKPEVVANEAPDSTTASVREQLGRDDEHRRPDGLQHLRCTEDESLEAADVEPDLPRERER
jgi:hypothetical protein